MITLDLSKQQRAAAISSLQRYFEENLNSVNAPIGDLPAGLLLNFFLEEIGPVIYNQAISDAQTRLTQRVSDLNGELYADEFQYWPRADAKRKSRR
ncbi:MAG TPA: DUF2164 domain-containing protein [Terracidiphilus sp.]|jgi:uncharacterized protein (DUF2164 family)|nr:DUF2164 domain-containing protein [Terracidiphilus sp.]